MQRNTTMIKDYEICVNDNNVFVDVEFKEYPSKNIYYFANANLFIYKLVDNEILEFNFTSFIEGNSKLLLDIQSTEEIYNNETLYNKKKTEYIKRLTYFLNSYDFNQLIYEKIGNLDFRNITQNFKSISNLLSNNEILK